MNFADALTASPLLYPIALDAVRDTVSLIRLTEGEYAAASFLDSRLLTPGVRSASVPWRDVRAATEQLPVRCHFVFHISHVGSTLLSRVVGEHPELFSIREPAIFRSLAEAHRTLGQGESPWARAELEDRLRVFLALWSRTFEPWRTVVIKATSFISEMAEHLLDRVPAARALFMYVAPDIFLRALLGGAMSDVEAGAEKRLARLHRRIGEDRWRLTDLSPGERVAMSWLSEMTALHAAAERFADRVFWLDFDRFLAGAETVLVAVLDQFGAGNPAGEARRILAGPTMKQYAKEPGKRFDAAFRRQLLEQAGRQHVGEISKGLQWLNRAAAIGTTAQLLERCRIERRTVQC
jgi:hypothetical protein